VASIRAVPAGAADELLENLDAISLEELDERAALLRRVDEKYVVDDDVFADLVRALAEDHAVLEIDGRRAFGYETVYFDTPDLRCYRDHVEGIRPRYKARTRLYRDSGLCHVEVKIKGAADETDKRQAEHPADAVDRLTDDAERLIRETVAGAGLEPPAVLEPVLRTEFRRITLAAADGGARLTCDAGLRLSRMDGHDARLRPDLVLVESKSEDGAARADDLLAQRGVRPRSLSKYRTGIDLLVEADPTGDLREIRGLFGGPSPTAGRRP
jgi:VTC domain